MTLHVKEAAEDDFFEIVAYYDTVRTSLGEDFGNVVFDKMDAILAHPEASTPISKTIRKVNLAPYPYQLIYQIRKNEIWVLAIWHNKRKPGSWKIRKRNNHKL